MKRKIKLSILITLCVALMGTMLFFGVNSIKAEATEREITASGTSSKVEWTLYNDGELYIDGTGSWIGTPWKEHYSSIKKITIAKGVTASSTLNFYFNYASGYPNLESVSVEDGNTAFFADENGVLYSYDKTKLFLFPNVSSLTEYNIPDSVTTIVRGAFCGNKTLTKITGCNGLKTIDVCSFYCCSSLRSITLPEGLTTVGNYAFYQCSGLENISIPDSVTELGNYTFKGCSALTDVSIGNGVSVIPSEAFMNCKSLESISFGNNVKGISESAFENCSALADVKIPESVTAIIGSAFQNCVSLKSITLPEGLTTIGDCAFYGCSGLSSVTIPDSVTKMNDYIFADCTALKNVTISKNVINIGNGAFKNCTALNEVIIPYGVKSIGKSAFFNCVALFSITIPDSVISIGDNAFSYCLGFTNITIPDSVTNMGSYAFYCCSNLEQITLSNNLSNIGDLTFRSCSKLKSIYIPNSVASIGNHAFDYCYELADATLSESITSIGSYAFNDCIELTNITIPNSVTIIDDYAFNDCEKLVNITVSENLKFIGRDAFYNTYFYKDNANWDNGFLYLDNYLIAAKSNFLPAECKIYSKTKLIASRVFYSFSNITSIEMSDNVEYINEYAFSSCTQLQSIKLSANLKEISAAAFSKCSALTSIKIPKNVSIIGNSTFNNCSSLESITLNEGLTGIGSMAFASTASLTEIYIPQTVTSLDSDAFKSSGITDIYYGDSKAEWKRLANGATFNDATVHYTLRSDDKSVIINHTDDNFDYEAGNVHLVVTDLGKASSSYEQNGFYNRLMANPIQVLDIKLVDGDGNNIQPLSDETITVKIKASEEFMNLMKSGLSSVSEYDIEAENIDFSNDCFVFENNGETVSVAADESFLKKFKIIHWYSDAVEPTDHESFTHDELSVENGYIVLETNHFSEYAVCTELVEFELGEIELANGEFSSVSVTVSDGTEVTYTSSDESVVTVDENGVITAVGPGTATITVTINGTNISDTCEATVPARDFTIKWIVDDVETEQTVSEQAVITQPETPEKEGCTFVGWTPSVPDTMPAQNIEFTAVWQVNQYKITFDTAGGSAVAPITLAYGSEISAPQNPVLDGYVFKGWIPAIPETMPAYDMTLTAVYEKVFVSDINIISLPNKTQYTYKVDSLDLSGIAVQVVYSDGSKEVITDTNAIKAYGFSADSTGTKTVTVEYGGCTADFNVTVSYAWWQWIIRILLLGFLWY